MNSDKQGTLADIRNLMAEATQRHSAGELAMAEVLYREVLKRQPTNFDALHMLAVIGHQCGQTEECLTLFAEAYAMRPRDPALLVNYGAALRKAGRFDDAIAVYDQALAIAPKLHEALFNKAQSLASLMRFEEAAEYCRRSLALKPRDPEALTALGNALKNMGRWEAAIDRFEEALVYDPHHVLAQISIAEIFRSRNWISVALQLYDRVLQRDPRNATARVHRSIALLKAGNLEEGWKDYDGRFWYLLEDNHTHRRAVPPMYWDGEDLTGKRIHVWTEQGLGDEIIYSSMVPDLAERSGRVVLECAPRMRPIYARSFPNVDVVSWSQQHLSSVEPSSVDYQASVGSIGRYLRPNLQSFPARRSYLKADPERVAAFKSKYGPGPLVGISWRSARARVEAYKSIALDDWAKIMSVAGVKFISLQYGDCHGEIEAFNKRFGLDLVDDRDVDAMQEMDTFFAQVAAMDLVVSISNTTIHTAGALGVPAWLLLPHNSMALLWYWFLRREDSPWYPSVRIYREQADRAERTKWWDKVMERIARDIVAWSSSHRES